MSKATNKTVLICPLDWGLGHATRVTPVIEYYVSRGDEVIIGGDGASFFYLKKRFPSLIFEKVPGYEVAYSKRVSFAVKMLLSLPSIYLGIKKEEKRVTQLHQQYNFDLIISDNRFGVHHKGVKSLFMTHQLNVKFPYFEKIIFKVQKKLIEKFDYCLVPDFPLKENLAGVLSVLKPEQKLNIPVHYVGALSRFYNTNVVVKSIKYKYVAVVSGPEPHKSGLVDLLINEFKKTSDSLAVLTYDYSLKEVLPENIKLFLNCDDEQFLDIVSQSDTMISRSGYTTLMDLIYLQKKVFFIPTPDQTEQVYLAEYAAQNGWANYCLQQNFTIDIITSSGKGFPFGKSPLNVVLGKIL
ncbi:MAG: hypothetical protein ACJA0Q_001935 [Saprospiraceae bacterium]